MEFNSGFKGLNKINIHNNSIVLSCESLLLMIVFYILCQSISYKLYLALSTLPVHDEA